MNMTRRETFAPLAGALALVGDRAGILRATPPAAADHPAGGGDFAAQFDAMHAQVEALQRAFLERFTGALAPQWRAALDRAGLGWVEIVDRAGWDARYAAGTLPGHGERITTTRFTWDVREEPIKARRISERVAVMDPVPLPISLPPGTVPLTYALPPCCYARGGHVALFAAIPAILDGIAAELDEKVKNAEMWITSSIFGHEPRVRRLLVDTPTPCLKVENYMAEFSLHIQSAGTITRAGQAVPCYPEE